MYFIGSGALLNHAVAYCLSLGLKVDGASCTPGDSAIARLRTLQIPVDECIDPNAHVSMITSTCTDGVIFSINNPRRIDDGLLVAGPLFFNVHNGLVQRYRGIAEICIFAAICRGENIYGVTLQQLKPAHKIDTGPVISQIEFAIGPQKIVQGNQIHVRELANEFVGGHGSLGVKVQLQIHVAFA